MKVCAVVLDGELEIHFGVRRLDAALVDCEPLQLVRDLNLGSVQESGVKPPQSTFTASCCPA
jgi:hypothetical protein